MSSAVARTSKEASFRISMMDRGFRVDGGLDFTTITMESPETSYR